MKTELKVLCIGLFLFLLATTISFGLKESPTIQPSEPNYQGMVMLGVYPNAPSRTLLENDEPVLRMSKGEQEYLLVKSNRLETNDFGKFFVVRTK